MGLKQLILKIIKWLRWPIALLFIYLVVRRVNWHSMGDQLSQANLTMVFYALIFGYGFFTLVSVWRWFVLLDGLNIKYPFYKAIQVYLIGGFAGFLVSDGVGAFARGFYVRTENQSVAIAMLSVLLDKIAELIGLLVFGVIGVILIPYPLPVDKKWIILGGTLGLIVLVFFVWLARGKIGFWAGRNLDKLLARRLRMLNENSITNLYQQLKCIPKSTWIKVALITVIVRLSHYGAVFILAKSIGITLSYVTIAAIMSLVGITVVLPISVAGGIGVREFMLVTMFGILNQSTELALMLSFLILISTLVWRVIGMVFWLQYPIPYTKQAQ